MTSSRRVFLAGAGAAFAARGQDIEEVDAYGGWMQHDLGANGRFRITRWRGGRWLVTPDGHAFVALGVASAASGGEIRGAGFNCLLHDAAEVGEDAIPHTVELNLAKGFDAESPRFPDFHDPAWRREAAEKISRTVPAAFEDAYSIGYALSGTLLISPTTKSGNWMTEIKAAPATAASKKAYIEFLRGRYGTFANYREKRGAPEPAQSFEDLLPLNLAEDGDGTELDAEDALFYQQMWSDAAEFLVSEIRRHDPDGIIYSFRYTGRAVWPDPWVESFLKGVGPHVDALLPEFSPSDPYRQMVRDIGRLTQKPVLAANGMEPEMFAVLVTRPWFLGGAAGRIPESEDQVARYRELSARKYTKRLEALQLPL